MLYINEAYKLIKSARSYTNQNYNGSVLIAEYRFLTHNLNFQNEKQNLILNLIN